MVDGVPVLPWAAEDPAEGDPGCLAWQHSDAAVTVPSWLLASRQPEQGAGTLVGSLGGDLRQSVVLAGHLHVCVPREGRLATRGSHQCPLCPQCPVFGSSQPWVPIISGTLPPRPWPAAPLVPCGLHLLSAPETDPSCFPAGDGQSRESSPIINNGDMERESFFEGKNMALFEVSCTFSCKKQGSV